MKKGSILIGAMLMFAAQVALAQAPTSPDTTVTQTPPATTPPPAAPPPAAPPAMAAPAKAPTAKAYRYGSISGSWLKPSGDFDKVASDGWAITLEGFQFIDPNKKIAIGSQVGYQSFGEKYGVSVSNFPVDAVLKFYPKPGTGRADLYVTGGLGFNYQRTDLGNATDSDYFFGTQAGVGLQLHGNGPAGLLVDAVYHWVFSNGYPGAPGIDMNFIALRGGLVIPLVR